MNATAVEVKERHIILSNAEARAILDGRKTQKRIALKSQPLDVITKGAGTKSPSPTRMINGHRSWCVKDTETPITGKVIYCRHGEIGDRLWVREALRCDDRGMYYAADETLIDKDLIPDNLRRVAEFCDPFHMPRWACRTILEITNVRAERLQEISEADAIAEGMRRHDASGVFSTGQNLLCYATAREAFANGWDALNAKRGYSWASNPWVWVIEFKKL